MVTLETIEHFAERNEWLQVERILGQASYLLPSGKTIRFLINEVTNEVVTIIDATNCMLAVDQPEVHIDPTKEEE